MYIIMAITRSRNNLGGGGGGGGGWRQTDRRTSADEAKPCRSAAAIASKQPD